MRGRACSPLVGLALLLLLGLDGAVAWQQRTSSESGFRPPWSSSSKYRSAGARGALQGELMRGLSELMVLLESSSGASPLGSKAGSFSRHRQQKSQLRRDLSPGKLEELLSQFKTPLADRRTSDGKNPRDARLEEILGGVPDFSDIAEFTFEPSPVFGSDTFRARGSATTKAEAVSVFCVLSALPLHYVLMRCALAPFLSL
jgi:hypothetical protein